MNEIAEYQIYNSVDSFDLRCESVKYNIRNIGMRDLLDM